MGFAGSSRVAYGHAAGQTEDLEIGRATKIFDRVYQRTEPAQPEGRPIHGKRQAEPSRFRPWVGLLVRDDPVEINIRLIAV